MPTTTMVAVLGGGIAALAGTYWDEAWHTHVGRDAFLSPPHLLLYAGVVVALAGLGRWAVAVRASTADGPAWWRDRALLLASAGGVVTLAAGPIDEAWHVLFGRDAVLWSPPHMLGVIGMLALAAGVLAGAARASVARGWVVLLGTGVLGAAMVPVMEYEADVPQFAALWYLPVLVAGGALAFGLIERVSPRRWTVTAAAAAYTLLRAGMLGALSRQGFSAAFVPPILAPAVVFDLTRGWSPPRRALAVTGTFVASYGLAMNLGYRGVRLDPTDLVVGGVLAGALASLVLAGMHRRPIHRTRRAGALTGTLLIGALVVLIPVPALAHDPGQGDLVAPIVLETILTADRAEVRATLEHPDCDVLEPDATVARRAGRAVHGPLERADPCTYTGTVPLDEPGRWFLYVELRDAHDQTVEAWIPATAPEQPGDTEAEAVKHDWAYHPAGTDGPTPAQVTAGILLYAISAALLILVIRTPGTPVLAAGGDGRRAVG